MAPNRTGYRDTKNTEQHIQNKSYDQEFEVLATEPLGYDGVNLSRNQADAVAVKITVVGSVTYLAVAAPGTAQATAKWQVKKIDETTGTVITFANGDSNFDNVATDLTGLTYS